MAALVFDTISQVTGGRTGTAPMIYSATTDNVLADVTAANALQNIYDNNRVKALDIFFINYDMAGTPKQGIFTVDASGKTLVAYPIV